MNNDDFGNNGSDKDPWESGFGGQQDKLPGDPAQADEPAEPSGGGTAPQQEPVPPSGEPEAPAEHTNGSVPEQNRNPDAAQPDAQPPRQDGNPYGQQYGPYGPYQQPYGSPYGQQPYAGQYGTYGNGGAPGANGQNGGAGGYGPYGGNPYGQQPYWNYQYGSQYQPSGSVPPQPPHKMNTGLRVFLWAIGVVAVGLIAGFTVFGIKSIQNAGSSATSETQSAASEPSESSAESSTSSENAVQAESGAGTDAGFAGITIAPKPSGTEMSVKNIYKKVIPSVVGVETTVTNTQNGASGVSEGTGIIATENGYILTNAHVVNYSRGNKVKVILHDNSEYQATVVGYDQTSDLAVLKINAHGLTAAAFGSVDNMEVGDQVLAIGNPGGISFAGSLTVGYISALNRSIESHSDGGMTYIQTDAAINPGNSGGPLVNLYGQVIGINSNKIVATGYEGMGFSIPVSHAGSVINDLIKNGYVSGRSRLGITAGTVTDLDRMKGFPQGVVIVQVGDDSDMKNAGVVAGDIITKADGKDITGMDDLYAVLNAHKPGDKISMTVYSTSDSEKAGGKAAGTTRNITVKLLEDKGETQAK